LTRLSLSTFEILEKFDDCDLSNIKVGNPKHPLPAYAERKLLKTNVDAIIIFTNGEFFILRKFSISIYNVIDLFANNNIPTSAIFKQLLLIGDDIREDTVNISSIYISILHSTDKMEISQFSDGDDIREDTVNISSIYPFSIPQTRWKFRSFQMIHTKTY
jgi:hypothetical protein